MTRRALFIAAICVAVLGCSSPKRNTQFNPYDGPLIDENGKRINPPTYGVGR